MDSSRCENSICILKKKKRFICLTPHFVYADEETAYSQVCLYDNDWFACSNSDSEHIPGVIHLWL